MGGDIIGMERCDMKKIVQTAGRKSLEEFAPQFAHFNDDVLFGENWNNQDIDGKTRSIITVVALMSSGITDSSLKFHLQNAKAHGVTQKEIAAVITHTAFYTGWPKGWAVFNLAKEVWNVNEGDLPYEDEEIFLVPISASQVGVFNVMFSDLSTHLLWGVYAQKIETA